MQEKQAETALDNISSPEPMIVDTRISAETNIVDVPLKHRLRSSSRQQYNRIEDEVDKVRDQEKEQSALEDQNAAAVLSIINIINKTSDEDKKNLDDVKEPMIVNDNNGQKMQTISTTSRNDTVLKHPTASVDVQKTNVIIPANNNVQPKIKKSTVKRPRSTTKHKHDQATISNNQFITEHEIMTMPTLIVCSKDEVDNLLISRSSAIKSTPTSRFLPIAPKDPNRIEKSMETLYLKTVNVAQQVPIKTLPTVIEESDNSANQTGLFPSTKKNKANKRSKIIHETDATVSIGINQQILEHPIELAQTNKMGSESITLYGNEANAETLLDGANLPTINLEEHISLSESGLSPYLKFNCSKTSQSHNLSDIDIAPIEKTASNRTNVEQHLSKNTDIITKRTPKSLLQSRSKNHRLSLSTPRKRSGHVRALDFSTPIKATGSNKKAIGEGNAQLSSTSTKRLKSVCRTSLFRSPSLSHTSTQKQKSPMKVCQSYRIPIATRSPAPKLMGGWDKCNGVGVIIGEVSPHGSTSASCSSFEDRTVQHKSSKAPIVESWDADLRKSVQLKDETGIQTTAKRRRDSIDKDNAIRKRTKYKSRSPKNKNRRKIHNKLEVNEKCNRDTEDIDEQKEENLRENAKNAVTEKTLRAASIIKPRNNEKENVTKVVISAADSMTNKSDKISQPAETSTKVDSSTNASNSNTVSEKKPVKKYAQLKTITTNLKKFDNENEKNAQNYSQISEMSRILFADSTQHILQVPHDMISLETPRKFDNMSGPPPTPRVLSPSSNLITPFIKISEDSIKVRSSFITTPEFPITPGIAITPKEETTRDIIKRGEYNSTYYKPSEQAQQNCDLSKSKNIQDSPIISSSHISLHSTHNSLTSDNTYQACASKLEITQFEVIKENLPREEAIKELKIASKDLAGTAELDNPVLIDRHIYKGINEYRETIIDNYVDDNYVADSHNDSVKNNNFSSSDTSSSSSSSTSSSSSSSSSSTSTSSNTDISAMCSPNNKCDKAPNKISIDTSSNSAEKDINVLKDANHISANIPDDVTCKRSDNVLFESESSPKKVFAIAKTDEQIETTLKETPAKDEALLNEADISETPSSSKSGVESLTNLSTKISAIITEDEKLSKSNNFNKPKNSNKIQILNKRRSKPKIINVQYIQSEHEQNMSMNDKLMHKQLEEKRQRMIAKIKDNPKLTLANRTKHVYKRILISSNSLKKNTQFGKGQRGTRPTVKYSHKINENISKDSKSPDDLQENSTINTRQKHLSSTRNRDLVNKCCNNEEEIKNRVVASKNTEPGITNHKNNSNELFNNDTTKQSHRNNNSDTTLLEKLIENYDKKESTQLHKIAFSSKDQECIKKSDTKVNNKIENEVEKICDIKNNILKEEEVFQDNINMHAKMSEEEVNPNERHITVQEIPDKIKSFSNYVDKSGCNKILKHKVDQVKRDLFCDEESDHRTCLTVKNNKTKTIEVPNLVEVSNRRNVESPKQELSTVLQCLQLVPACKTEQNDENQIGRQREEPNESENRANNESQAIDIHNYKAEYHFVYDDSMPVRKRRRRYSNHELQVNINHNDLSDPNTVECIKIMKATEFEEIFNLPPKSKKRTINKKSSVKNIKVCKTVKDTFILKDNITKPLATSSPVEELSKGKMKKTIIKTAATNRNDNDTQSDIKKKQQKHQEKGKIAKIFRYIYNKINIIIC